MILPQTSPVPLQTLRVQAHDGPALAARLPALESYVLRKAPVLPLSLHPAWSLVLARSLGHTPYCLEVLEGDQTRGCLTLAYVRSWLFGRFLVSLPYLNHGGVLADDDAAARLLIDRAVELAGQLDVRYLELRHEQPLPHPALAHARTDKVHMRLDLPATADQLWKQLSQNVRYQVNNGRKKGLAVVWGGRELLAEFYAVFSRNMRDLGTPVYGKALFRSILEQFPDRSEICVVRLGKKPLAGAVLLHGEGITEVPSASSLRRYNHTCANMLMYWHLLERAVQRGQDVFDFGRSSKDSGTFRFKKQWGAAPLPAEWQYALRAGDVKDMRPDNPRYQRLVRIWRRLPLFVTRLLGPAIVRGIP